LAKNPLPTSPLKSGEELYSLFNYKVQSTHFFFKKIEEANIYFAQNSSHWESAPRFSRGSLGGGLFLFEKS
jgi:phage anti-repressor protein